VLLGHILNDVFVEHHVVGGLDQGIEAEIDFGLAGGGHLVMLAFNLDAQLFHEQAHLGADVLLGIGRADGKIPFLVADFVAEVGHFLATGVPDGFLAVDGVEGAVGFVVEPHVIEDEELGFGPEDGGIGQAGALEILFAALGDAARVAIVGFFGAGFGDGAGQGKSRLAAEGVNESGGRVGHGQHVGGFNAFPAADT